ncbi:MAG: hypothetical protein CL942_13020 [Desulfovibrio sp.]|nr:hypothetical protein [Desulfovibrio sp.]
MERIEAISSEGLAEAICGGNLGWPKYIMIVGMIRKGLQPYVLSNWLDKNRTLCMAEQVKPALLAGVNTTFRDRFGNQFSPFFQTPEQAKSRSDAYVSFSFNGLEVAWRKVVFNRQNVEEFLGSITGKDKRAEFISSELARAKEEIYRLRGENKGLETSNGKTKTAAANEGRNQRTAKMWQAHMTTAVKMALEIASKPDKEYTNRELGEMAASYGSEWIGKKDRPGTPLEVFKKALPSLYHKGPGAPKQGED